MCGMRLPRKRVKIERRHMLFFASGRVGLKSGVVLLIEVPEVRLVALYGRCRWIVPS
jgi:hypothetical protein